MWIQIAAQTSPTRSKSAWRGEERRPVSELNRNGSPKYIAYIILYSSPEQLLSITREVYIKLFDKKYRWALLNLEWGPFIAAIQQRKGQRRILEGFVCFCFCFNGKHKTLPTEPQGEAVIPRWSQATEAFNCVEKTIFMNVLEKAKAH